MLPKHLPSLRHEGACIKQIPSKPCYQWPQPLALWRVSRDWVQELLPWKTLWSGRTGRLCTRPKRAAAHRSTDTHTGRHEKTGQKAPESHQEASESGRCGVGWGCSIGASRGAAERGKPSSSPIVRSWSRNPKFDTRLPVSKAGGRSLAKGKALALAFLRSVIPKERGSGEVGNCRTVGRPSGACPLWAGQLSTERCSGPSTHGGLDGGTQGRPP